MGQAAGLGYFLQQYVSWGIGFFFSMSGSSLFGDADAGSGRVKNDPIVGPRLGDVNITGSRMGMPHPILYGTIRMAGNINWHSGIEELIEETTTEFKVDAD